MLQTSQDTVHECIRISKKEVQPDIILFSKFIVNRKLPNKDKALQEDLATQMAEKSDGMFLFDKVAREPFTRREEPKAVAGNCRRYGG